jgi:hypothetical protein
MRALEKQLHSHTRRTVLQVLRLEEEAQQRLNALQPAPRHHARVVRFFHTMTDMHASRPFMHHHPPRRQHLSRLTPACVACPPPLPRAIACRNCRGGGCIGKRVSWRAKCSLARATREGGMHKRNRHKRGGTVAGRSSRMHRHGLRSAVRLM